MPKKLLSVFMHSLCMCLLNKLQYLYRYMVAVSWLQMFQPPTSNIIRSLLSTGVGERKSRDYEKGICSKETKRYSFGEHNFTWIQGVFDLHSHLLLCKSMNKAFSTLKGHIGETLKSLEICAIFLCKVQCPLSKMWWQILYIKKS